MNTDDIKQKIETKAASLWAKRAGWIVGIAAAVAVGWLLCKYL